MSLRFLRSGKMRKDFGVKPFLYPEPVLIIGTYCDDGTPCAMNAAWGGIHEENELFLCLSPEHKTVENILKRKEFTVSMATADTVAACDYVGIVSGNDVPDKVKRAGLTAAKSSKVNAPIFDQLPMAVECRLKSYNDKTCELIAEIVNVSVDEKVLNENGKVDPVKMRPIIYDGMNHDYYEFGKVVGKAFSDGKKLK